MRSARCSVLVLVLVPCLVLVLGALFPARAQVGMPDPSQMSGVPLPSPELSTGTMTVRVVRGSLSNNLPGQRVELSVQGQSNPRIETTDELARITAEVFAEEGARVNYVAVQSWGAGVVNLSTWNALFDVNVTGPSLN